MSDHACIVRKSDGHVLVRARRDEVLALEDNFYFPAAAIDRTRFEVSDRPYLCRYKGTCYWVDYKSDSGFINDVAWVYPDPKPGYRKIAGRFGFYPEHRYCRYTECD